MKVLKEQKVVEQTVEDQANEGLLSLIGETITIFSAIYIYTGKLVGVNTKDIKLEGTRIVYETGPFTEKNWKDAQPLPHQYWYIRTDMIESYGIMK